MEKKRERCVDEDDALKADAIESLPKESKTEAPENRMETKGDEKTINGDKFENRSEEKRFDRSASGTSASPSENEKIEVLWDIKQESDNSESVLIENVWWPALVGSALTGDNNKYHQLHYEEYKSFAEEQRRIRFLSPGYLFDLEEKNSMKYRRPGEDWEEVYGNIALSLDDMKDLEGEDDGTSVEEYLMAAAKDLPHTQKIQLARGVQKFKSLLASKFNSFEGDVVTEEHMLEWINEFLQELDKD